MLTFNCTFFGNKIKVEYKKNLIEVINRLIIDLGRILNVFQLQTLKNLNNFISNYFNKNQIQKETRTKRKVY